MKLTKVCLILFASLALAVSPSQAQTDSSTAANKPAAPAKAKYKSYSGKIASVDNDSKTVTLQGTKKREIKITSKTKIYNDGEPATLADAAVGLHVSGRERQDADGTWFATTLRIGEPKHKAPSSPAAASPDATNPASPNPPPAPAPKQ